MDTFYIVVSRTKNYTGDRVYANAQPYTHSDLKQAVEESRRLARTNQDKVFFVMAACFKSGAETPVITESLHV
jgi:hypothetical protein